jgi:hypothetical protein
MPSVIKKKYLGYASFAGQTIQNVFGKKLEEAKKYKAEILSSVVLMNNKKDAFTIALLPPQAQWSPVFVFLTADFNHDGTTDILTAGNFYGVSPYEGRYDAGYGTVMLNENNAGFKTPGSLQTGFTVDGEIRDIKIIRTIQGKNMIAVARNNDSIRLFTLSQNNIAGRKK